MLALLSSVLTVQAKETKTIEVPNCYAQAREIAKRGVNIRTNVFGENSQFMPNPIYTVSFDTSTHKVNISCNRDKMTVEKWSNQEWDNIMRDSRKKTETVAKQIGL